MGIICLNSGITCNVAISWATTCLILVSVGCHVSVRFSCSRGWVLLMRDGCVVWSWTVHLIQYVSLIRIKCFHCHILLFNDALLLLDKIATWVHNCLGVLVLRLLDRRGYILLKHNGFETATLVIWRWSRSVLIQGRCLLIVSTWWRRVPLLLRWQLWRCQYSCLRLGRRSQGAVDFIIESDL